MGAGIAQLAAQAGARTVFYDAVGEGLERGAHQIEAGLTRLVERGKLTASDADAVRARLRPVSKLEDLAACELVIEAVPEHLELKLEVLRAVAEVVDPGCVVATNTSSLSVTRIAAGIPCPERVVGLHFFNPAPVMRLVEVVAGEASAPAALAAARALGEAMGKRAIDAADIAGFLVNRCNRPFSLEALRLLTARVGTVEQIDRIARLGGGFRMGPFELMDLIGIETNHAVAESFYSATYGEPRYQPSDIQARMVAAGRLGRKTGRGWYEYEETGPDAYRVPDPEPLPSGGGEGRRVIVTGDLPVAMELRGAAAAAAFDVDAEAADGEPWLTLVCDGRGGVRGPRARLLFDASLHQSDPEAAGFHVLPPFAASSLIESTETALTDPVASARLAELVAALGRHCERVADAPGLVLGRIVCALINEAAFLIGAGNGTQNDVDAGMELGVNHPRGPVAWSRAIGLRHVVATLDALHRELGEPRYRVAPLLRQRLALGELGLGEGRT
jgi:3-hydroxybutyryl-CoA dehydrogenase